jgi:hypothetical protein
VFLFTPGVAVDEHLSMLIFIYAEAGVQVVMRRATSNKSIAHPTRTFKLACQPIGALKSALFIAPGGH